MESTATQQAVLALPFAFAFLTGMIAKRRNRNILGWAALGLVTGPVAWIVAATLRPLEKKPQKPAKPKHKIRDYSEGLWRLTVVLTFTAPVVGWLMLFLLDEAGIVNLRKEEIFFSSLPFAILPYIVVKLWLWIKRGYQIDTGP